jgi:hypothetical protein
LFTHFLLRLESPERLLTQRAIFKVAAEAQKANASPNTILAYEVPILTGSSALNVFLLAAIITYPFPLTHGAYLPCEFVVTMLKTLPSVSDDCPFPLTGGTGFFFAVPLDLPMVLTLRARSWSRLWCKGSLWTSHLFYLLCQ